MSEWQGSWDLVNAAEGSVHDGEMPAVEDMTLGWGVPFDQRRVALAKQDRTCGDAGHPEPSLPTWPPRVPLERPALSRHSSHAGPPSAGPAPVAPLSAGPAPVAPPVAPAVAARSARIQTSEPRPETSGERVMRCVRGICYDVQHWAAVDAPGGSVKLAHILGRHDRFPVSCCLCAAVLVALVAALLRR